MDEIAERLDSGEEDLQVEGSIAKLFATESANKTADDAMQALGGYGYIAEYEVEKIKRDVKITCIYEGTSEIQQSIISTFRWKTSRKTKGAYYGKIADEMETLGAALPATGGRFIGLAAAGLNQTIDLVHEKGLTRQQCVMFALADMMTHVEVGASLARKAASAAREGSADAEKLTAMSRIFADEVAQTTGRNILKIVEGSGILEPSGIDAFLASTRHSELIRSASGILPVMDKVADILFEREK
jgi:alkylation response protein AidB-like acyl-CoA dehydrogenase